MSAPPPPAMPPPPSPYRDRRQVELDALKQRGLARMLNKHFTSVTKSLAEEKAAADAALRDLERRKANTSEPQTPSYGELSPYDKLYLELQQKKADCKKKERETLLLYQRYVNRFGSTGAVTLPSVPFSSPDGSRSSAPTDAVRRPAPSKDLVPQLATNIDKTVEELVDRGMEAHPSSHTMGMDETYQTMHASLEFQDRAFAKQLEQERGVDARSTPKGSRTLAKGTWQKLPGMELPPAPPLMSESSSGENDLSDDTVPTLEDKSSEDDESKSVVSGLTDAGAMSEAESQLLNYLKSETEAIRQILEEEEVVSATSRTSLTSSYSTEVASQTDLAAKKAEEMLNEMKKILAESQAQAESVSASSVPNHEPRELQTPNPHEKWMVYFDENHQRNYYHEINSNIVQWECPVPEERPATIPEAMKYAPETLVPMSDFTRKSPRTTKGTIRVAPQISYQDVMPEMNAGRPSSSRRLKYRQLQRRKRKRRRRIAVLISIIMVGGGVYYKDHVGQAVNGGMARVHPLLPKSWQWDANEETFLGAVSDAICEMLPEQYKWETPRKKKQKQARAAAAAARREAAARKRAEEEAARRATEAALRTLEHPEHSALAVKRKQRPWMCNIPLAYLFHKKCWHAARSNPLFDLKELVQSMMQ